LFSNSSSVNVKTIHQCSGAARKKSTPKDEEAEIMNGESGWANSSE
jgi:hypothetical protein